MRFFSMLMILVCFAVASGSALAGDDGKVYGNGVALSDTVKVSDLMDNPDAYVGKTIAIEGVTVAVCAHRGCWINIASDTEGEIVRVKVNDGDIVFPPELVGDTVTAEGVWTANTLDLETTKKVCAHNAEEAGEKFDPESVTECMTVYQLSGTGAVAKR